MRRRRGGRSSASLVVMLGEAWCQQEAYFRLVPLAGRIGAASAATCPLSWLCSGSYRPAVTKTASGYHDIGVCDDSGLRKPQTRTTTADVMACLSPDPASSLLHVSPAASATLYTLHKVVYGVLLFYRDIHDDKG